ncbi:MAG: hypothetical protein ABI867_44935, partial [Kofleriaceae bacterium]
MRLRTLGLAALLSTSLYQPTGAFIRPKGAEAPIVSADQGPRTHRQTSFLQAGTFAQAGLGSWSALWDHDTDVPLRMWGPGQIVAGSIADAAIAEAAARQFLAQHISTLAPGSAASDFELVTNQLDPSGTLRSVAFVQRSSGVRVLGGAVGFAFKADRLVMINSTALPHVAVQIPASRLAPAVVQRAATRWLDEAGKSVVARANPGAQAAERVIIPVVRPRLSTGKSIAYHIAEEVAVDATNNEVGSWKVWIDAGTGAPIARKSTISYASGRV